MKRYIFSLLFALLAVTAFADEKSDEIIMKLTSAFGSDTYKITFVITVEDTDGSIEGEYLVSGDKFRLTLPGSVIFEDGKTRHTYSETDNTMVIEDKLHDEIAMLANPAKMLSDFSKEFNTEYKGPSKIAERKVEVIGMKPKTRHEFVSSVVAAVDAGTFMPVGFAFDMVDGEDVVALDILSVDTAFKPSNSDFIFDKKRYQGVEIIDFR